MIKNLQVWVVFGTLVLLAFVAMFFISRSNMVIERSRSAAEKRALQSRLEAERDQRVARAVRRMDREAARLLAIESRRPISDFLDREEVEGGVENQVWRSPAGPVNSYALLYFSQQAGQPIRTHWSIGGRDLKLLVPSLLDVSATPQWQTFWEDTEGQDWMPSPEVLYKVNLGVQILVDGDDDPAEDTELSSPPNRTPAEIPLTESDADVSRSMYPVWIDQQLCLIRWIPTEQGGQVQGCVLHWERLRESLVRELDGSLKNASPQLLPVNQSWPAEQAASFSTWLPLRISVNALTVSDRPYPSDGGWVLLGVGWLFLFFACAAIGMLLHTVLRMSNRREAFVSSVTHELRTPLTTFRLYADLLAKAPDAEKTRAYARTLQIEAERLSHLVENVLCYSRMEKRGITSHHRMTPVGELLDAMVPRLEEHCFRNGMILDFADASPGVRKTEILTDPSAVDRILVNLVDNACKYGKTMESQVVELQARQEKRWLVLEVADKGPGLAKAQRRRLFKAYNHGQIGAKSPNTTIGLGLNICFNLARALGGSLGFEDNHPGCRFILKLPMDLQHR